jgi:hypothetical protein
MEMPRPTEAHRNLHPMVGSWVGQEKLNPSPWDPKGGTASATVQNRLGLGGFIVLHDYEQQRGATTTFSGHGVLWWDGAQQTYLMQWWDSMGFPPNLFRGTFVDGELTMTSTSPQGHNRAVWDFREDGRYHFRMDVSPDGERWMSFMEGDYTRQG